MAARTKEMSTCRPYIRAKTTFYVYARASLRLRLGKYASARQGKRLSISSWRPSTSLATRLVSALYLSFTILLPIVTHPPPSPSPHFLGPSTVTTYNVSDANYNRSFKFLTLPSYIPSCHKFLPKADQERPSRPSTCPTIAGMRLHQRHPHHSSRSSSTI